MIERILQGVSEGIPLAQIMREDGMPDPTSFYSWVKRDADLSQSFARAREIGFDVIAADTLAIIDADPERVAAYDAEGNKTGERIDSAAVQWAKNRVEQRMKLLAKWDPKRYGDKIQHADAEGGKLPTSLTVNFVRSDDRSS